MNNIELGKVSVVRSFTPEEHAARMRRRALKAKEFETEEAGVAVWDCGSSLYDSYEWVCITHLIERGMIGLPYPPILSNPITSQFSKAEQLNGKRSARRSSIASSMKGMWKRKEKTKKRKEKTKKNNWVFWPF